MATLEEINRSYARRERCCMLGTLALAGGLLLGQGIDQMRSYASVAAYRHDPVVASFIMECSFESAENALDPAAEPGSPTQHSKLEEYAREGLLGQKIEAYVRAKDMYEKSQRRGLPVGFGLNLLVGVWAIYMNHSMRQHEEESASLARPRG